MPGAGYNIPISVSYARTDTINPILNADTTFNFSSPWGSGGTNDNAARNVSSATATSSAAEGGNAGASGQSTTSPSDLGGTSSTGSNTTTYALIAIALIGFLWLQHHK